MVFNSLTFVVFLAVVLAFHYSPWLSWRGKKWALLLASYVFYAAWNPPFVILLWISTAVDWHAAHRIAAADSQARGQRRMWLLMSLASNLGMLAFFKYGGFVNENLVVLLRGLGVQYSPPEWGLVLPVGISFYTFQTLSFTIDVYRGDLRPGKSWLDFALYVTFFPQLVAGPIVRATEFLPQLTTPRRASAQQFGWGVSLLIIGLFQKVILADGMMAPEADKVFAQPQEIGLLDAWVGVFAFSTQIFFDFAGYSTCAIGVALCLGFELPDNFRRPYAAIGFSDFWRRWHISLSTWLRDYLYIPLGGNRLGSIRTYINLMLTMLLGGLWHGAAWRFVAWGGLHGAYLVAERRLAAGPLGQAAWLKHRAIRVGLGVGTFLLVCLTWVFFRAHTFGDAMWMFRSMVGLGGSDTLTLGATESIGVLGVTASLLAWQACLRDSSTEHAWRLLPWPVRGILLGVLAASLMLAPGDDRAFIYFQF